LTAPIDWAAVKARHPLTSVARRTGLSVPDAGAVMVCCPMPDHNDTNPSMHLELDKNMYHCHPGRSTGAPCACHPVGRLSIGVNAFKSTQLCLPFEERRVSRTIDREVGFRGAGVVIRGASCH
jgi:hypothetical protein